MKSSRRKRRRGRSSASTQPNGDVVNGGGGVVEEKKNKEVRDLRCLAEAFSLVSLDDVSTAYRDAEGDVNKAADILGGFLTIGDDPSAGSSSSSSERFMDSTSSSSERFFESTSEDPPTSSNLSSCSSDRFFESDHLVQNPNRGKGFGGSKQKRVVASTGMVSSVLGKSYVSSSPIDGGKQCSSFKWKGNGDDVSMMGNEEAENFLFSMLGYGSELSMDVVRDVFSQCGYDVEKASDVLLDLSGSSYDQCKYGTRSGTRRQDLEPSRYLSPGTVSESSLTSLENEVQEILQSWDPDRRFYSEVLASSPKRHSESVTTEPNLPQKILDSLFKIPKSSVAQPGSMNWKNVVKKIESFGQRMDSQATGPANIQVNMEYDKGEEYHVFREAARQHWETMRSYFQKAATAYSRGDKDYAAYLSEQGRAQNKMAREADEKASKDIFQARNKEIQNVVTIDLHGQHVEQAMRVLKIHLLFMKCTSSVQILRVITGCGSHGFGKGKLKQEVINLAQKAGVECSEENQGTVLIKLHGRHAWSLADFESDSE